MPRGRRRAELSIVQLQRLLKERDRQVGALGKRRRGLLAELASVDKQIAALTGGKADAGPGRAAAPEPRRRRRRGGMTLPEAVTKVLTDAGAPIRRLPHGGASVVRPLPQGDGHPGS